MMPTEILLTTLADALGGPVPVDAVLKAEASKTRTVGVTVTAPDEIRVRLRDGVPEVPVLLDALGVDLYWTISVSFPSLGGRAVLRYVQFPDVPSIEWAALTDVDRETMQPDPGAVPAWTAAVAQVQALIDGAQTDVEGAVTVAVGEQVPVAVSDAVAVQVAPKVTAAETARDEAVAAKDAAEAVPAQVDTAMADQVGSGGAFDTKLNATIDEVATPAAEVAAANFLGSQPGVEAAAAAAAGPAVDEYLGMPPGDLLKQSTNMFDKTTVLTGHVLSSGAAVPTPNIDYNVSAPIPVTAGVTYIYSPLFRVTFFAADDSRVTDHTQPRQTGTRLTPAGTTYVRLSIHKDDMGAMQMNPGTTLLPYEPGGAATLNEDLIGGGSITPAKTSFFDGETIDPVYLPADAGGFLVDAEGLGEVYTAPTIAAQPGLDTLVPTDVYGWYDALVTAHPEYVTKADLGLSEDGGHHLYSYTFKPERVPGTVDGALSPSTDKPLPAVILISGVHPFEESAIYHLWRFGQALCTEWETSPVLEAFRWGIEVVIVPLGNPWGFAGVHQRYNVNGVDIARNFPTGWAAGANSGTAPLSEAESTILNQLMLSLAPRAVAGSSFHNFDSTAENPNMIWQSAASDLTLILAQHNISRMTRKWRAEQAWITATRPYLGYASMAAPPGSEGRQMTALGFPGATFETARNQFLDGGTGAEHTERAMTLGYEATVNYIAMLTRAGLEFKGKPAMGKLVTYLS